MTKALHAWGKQGNTVVITGEHRSTVVDEHCGGFLHHPKEQVQRAGRPAKDFRGSMQCGDRNCVSRGRFMNRDVHAACNIGNVFVDSLLFGGFLGSFSRCAARGADGQLVDPAERLSLFQFFAL